MNARLADYRDKIVSRQIARINALVCFPQKTSAALNRLIVPLHNRPAAQFLLWRHRRPSFRPPIASLFPGGMALTALIGEAKGARRIPKEVFSSGWHLLFAAIANAMTVLGAVIFSHALNVGALPIFSTKVRRHKMEMTAHKAIASLIASFVAIATMFGISTGWATPGLIEAVAAIGGAVLTAAVTYMVPNKPKV